MIKQILLLIIVLCSSVVARAVESDPILERYITLALTQNPLVGAAESRMRAYSEKIPQAAALPDPMLSFGLKNLSWKNSFFSKNDLTERWISLEQMFPFPGVRALKQEMAQRNQDMVSSDADAAQTMLRLEVKEMYYEWAYIRASVDLVLRSKELMQSSYQQALSAYQAGMGTQSDVLRAQSEVTKFDLKLTILQQQEQSAVANLNICCALPPGSLTTPPAPLEFHQINISFDSLWVMIQRSNPMLKGYRARTRMAKAGTAMARRAFYPDFSLGAEYMRRGEGNMAENMFSVMGGITLPLYWTKNQNHALLQRHAEFQQTEYEADSVLKDLHFKVTDLTTQAGSLNQQINLYQNQLIPQTQQAFASAQVSYTGGKIDFMALLSSQMMLLEMERDRLMKTADYLMIWSRIEALTGSTLR